MPQMTQPDPLTLILEIYRVLLDATESFHNRTGGNLAYLFGAIVTGGAIDLSEPDDGEFLECLRTAFPADHPVWRFIETGAEEDRGEEEKDDLTGELDAEPGSETEFDEDRDRRRGLYGPEYPGEKF
ncbi:MAG: hypothetical protein HY290_29600 [Planctomycetia bacterium]|nr:hypothetical protein [Planctomycetia bacterium]